MGQNVAVLVRALPPDNAQLQQSTQGRRRRRKNGAGLLPPFRQLLAPKIERAYVARSDPVQMRRRGQGAAARPAKAPRRPEGSRRRGENIKESKRRIILHGCVCVGIGPGHRLPAFASNDEGAQSKTGVAPS